MKIIADNGFGVYEVPEYRQPLQNQSLPLAFAGHMWKPEH